MKITAMKCPNCGASVEVQGEGIVKCEYCSQTFYAQSEKAPEVHNTVINNYNYGYEEEEEEYIYRGGRRRRRRRTNKEPSPLHDTIYGIVMIIFLVIGPIILLFIATYGDPYKDTLSADNPYRYYSDKKKALEYEKMLKEYSYYNYSGNNSETESTEPTESQEDPNKREWLEVGADESDISYISKMSSLYTLIIHDASNITDYSALKNSPSISRLTIRNAKLLKNADFLLSMNNLKYLDIEGSQISDLSVLKDRLSLMYLTLENNENISDYTFLESLTSLKKLRLTTAADAKIPDLSKNKFLKSIVINGEIK